MVDADQGAKLRHHRRAGTLASSACRPPLRRRAWPDAAGAARQGALPLSEEKHLETLTGATVAKNGFHKVTAVLTLNKAFELQPSMFNTPVSSQDWEAAGVKQLILPVEDFTRPSMSQYTQCCAFIDEHSTAHSTVYAHCKAGRGRSCSVVCCYLVHRGMSRTPHPPTPRARRSHGR